MRIAIIGAGNMGGALIRGWAKKGLAKDLTVVAHRQQTLDKFRQAFDELHTTLDGAAAVEDADVVVLAVKPWLVESVVGTIRPSLQASRQLIVSIAANVGVEKLNAWLGPGFRCCYVMPNVAAEFHQAMSFVVPGPNVAPHEVATILDLFALVGRVQLCDEKTLAAGNMLAGCGIAYVMRFIQAMAEGGVEMGLYPENARQIAMQAMQGAVTLLSETGIHPAVAIDKVTTPGGLTIKGLNEMSHAGFDSAVIRALKAGLKVDS
ncbi:MAG: pyrroline-5-carboxylate reductase [Bacteroidales bacterium]|nr:pyrroline-5-carboxylate reductase [Bacteroidales bacterium]